jgi:hypothetical protein
VKSCAGSKTMKPHAQSNATAKAVICSVDVP